MDLYLNDLYSTLDLTHVSDSSLFIVGNFFFFSHKGLVWIVELVKARCLAPLSATRRMKSND